MAFMDLTYVVKQTCQKSHSWPLFCEKVHICHCKANGFFLMLGTHIGRVKVIFRLPDRVAEFGSNRTMPAPEEWAEHGPLAYVEWFAKLPACADPIHMMYEVRKMPLHTDGKPPDEVVSLSTI